jgi:hypothetical protein
MPNIVRVEDTQGEGGLFHGYMMRDTKKKRRETKGKGRGDSEMDGGVVSV